MDPRLRRSYWYFIVFLLSTIALTAACSSHKRLSKDDVRIAASDLRTFAAASKLLSEQNTNAALTGIFFKNQSQLLLEKVQDVLAQLDAPGNENEQMRGRAAALGSQLADRLERMQNGQPAVDDAFAFQSAAEQAKALEDQLKDQ